MRLLWLLLKDIRVESRRGFEVISVILFVFISSLLISQSSYVISRDTIVPAFWLTVVFIAIFTSTTSFIREIDKNTFFGLKLLPVSPLTVFMSKTIFTFILISSLGTLELLLLATFSSYWEILDLITIFMVFSLYLSIVSSFSSALVMYSEGRSFLVPMLMFIFISPVILTILKQDIYTLLIETSVLFAAFLTLSEYVLEV